MRVKAAKEKAEEAAIRERARANCPMAKYKSRNERRERSVLRGAMAKENAMANADNGPDNLVPPMPSGLREKYPNLERFWPFLQTLRRESPRGTVLTSCGFVEQQLKEILLAFMLDDTAVEEFIEGRNAPLGTLSSRISALGLITKDEYDDLTLMRRIRNDFAHQVETTFDTPSVVDRCKLLRHKAEDYGDLKVGSFGQFQSAAIGVIMSLTNRAFYVGRQRRKNEQWPY